IAKPLYKIVFHNHGKVYELYARRVAASAIWGFTDVGELVFDVPDAIDNALALAQRCNLELRLGTYYLPAFPVPSDHTLDSWIRSEARDGLAKRLETQPL